MADNLSPLQRLAVECFEDARVDHLVLRQYPGLRRCLLALHPRPVEGACDPATASCLRHRLAMLSRALLDPAHGYRDAALNDFVRRFHALLAQGDSSTADMATLALRHARHAPAARATSWPDVFFTTPRSATATTTATCGPSSRPATRKTALPSRRPPRRTDDVRACRRATTPSGTPPAQNYRPDWVSVYEALHPSGDAGRHRPPAGAATRALARQLKRLLDLLKPQDRVRMRYQEEGSELDLDVALRSLIDWRAGAQPDPRILMSHRTDGRSIAVLLLLDLSQSLNDAVPGTGQTRLAAEPGGRGAAGLGHRPAGRPALRLPAFIPTPATRCATSTSRAFDEHWDDAPKARLAAVQAGYSTRMGAAHAPRRPLPRCASRPTRSCCWC